MIQTETLIIGASMAGLASAACLQKQGIKYIVIEKEKESVAPWRNHYHRLHLHTNKRISALPFKKYGPDIPRYPSRAEVINYADAYQKEFNIEPIFNTEATSVKRVGDNWLTQTATEIFQSKYLVMATGAFGHPRPLNFKGMETFTGTVVHSYAYKTGSDYRGKKVLVVGFGNSACEIAIDLYEQGAMPSLSVRSPVNVIPRDIMGIPVLEISLLLSHLPPRIADAVSAPLLALVLGDITKLGLKKMSYGPLEQIARDAKIPLLDIGTIGHIRKGHIQVYSGIDYIVGNTVCFSDGQQQVFDAVIAAIGYSMQSSAMANFEPGRIADARLPLDKQKYFGKDGLYFCGYRIAATGQIRTISRDAQKIAAGIAVKVAAGTINSHHN
ncbi:NAD(P)/FAD-dependent oxidoreductase [Ferruginibacter paludis]|uniref:flavin-containing monooxygenase n=1 Tax=Ferruginibacter paludis TaxID=1310417 RepID=UPI0025B45133|nr:NAD(P)/FAD-dependent oxidoreductase [Ferruginibacter paludis]MDN3657268.1 NAD(P)/FAD-dependent oxidoreductase [Ferruginibacter paludis]